MGLFKNIFHAIGEVADDDTTLAAANFYLYNDTF